MAFLSSKPTFFGISAWSLGLDIEYSRANHDDFINKKGLIHAGVS
jgi:hypothetical protein